MPALRGRSRRGGGAPAASSPLDSGSPAKDPWWHSLPTTQVVSSQYSTSLSSPSHWLPDQSRLLIGRSKRASPAIGQVSQSKGARSSSSGLMSPQHVLSVRGERRKLRSWWKIIYYFSNK